MEQLLKELDQDPRLVVEVIDLFLQASPNYRHNLKSAFETNDWRGLAELAHTLKGTLSNFGPNDLTDRAQELMRLAQLEDFTSMREKLFTFQKQLEKFESDLQEIKTELRAGLV